MGYTRGVLLGYTRGVLLGYTRVGVLLGYILGWS